MNFSYKKSTVASAVVAGIEVELIDEMRPIKFESKKSISERTKSFFFSIFLFLGFEKFSPVETKRKREK